MSDIFSAREDAFRASMVGSGSVASAPSNLQTTQMDDDHEDGMTHSCSGCAGGKPCGNCGGGVAHSDPAYQALQWALLQHADARFTSPTWYGPLVAQSYNDSVKVESASTMAISEFLRTTLRQRQMLDQAEWAATSGDGGRGVFLAAWDPRVPGPGPGQPPSPNGWDDGAEFKKLKLPMPVGTDPVTGRGIPYSNTAVGSPGCCVQKFEYPKSTETLMPLPPPSDQGPGGKSLNVGFWFEVHAEFIPGTLDPTCDCACCEFHQYQLKYQVSAVAETDSGAVAGNLGDTFPTSDRNYEDCVWLERDAQGHKVKSSNWKPGDQKPPPSVAGNTVELACGGRRDQPDVPGPVPSPKAPKGSNPPVSGYPPGDQHASCTFDFQDRPSVPIMIPPKSLFVHFHFTGSFLGVIWDRCYGVPRRVKTFDFDIDGVLGADSKFYTLDPKTKRYVVGQNPGKFTGHG